jgi:DNA polymerase-3 subunit beta
MKVIISRAQLVKLIGAIQGVVSSKPTIPILANVLIEAFDQNLTISATDLTVSTRAVAEANVIEEGAITLPAKRFFQLVREMTSQDIEIACASGEIADIRGGSANFRIHGMHKSEFPSLPDMSQGQTFFLSGSTFKEMLIKSVFAAAREDSRHVLNGVFMHIEDHLATFTGTDGKRLARIHTPIELDEEHKHGYLIPLKASEEMVKMIGDEEKVQISLLPDKIGLEVDSVTLVTKLLSGDYPDTDRIIPKSSEKSFTLHREELMSLLKQISLFTSEKNHSVHFTFNPGELVLTANSSEIGDGKVSMPVDYSGETFEVAFNPFFFHDILRHCKDETVSFAITNAHNPGLITDSTTANFVIMPMRLSPVS